MLEIVSDMEENARRVDQDIKQPFYFESHRLNLDVFFIYWRINLMIYCFIDI